MILAARTCSCTAARAPLVSSACNLASVSFKSANSASAEALARSNCSTAACFSRASDWAASREVVRVWSLTSSSATSSVLVARLSLASLS